MGCNHPVCGEYNYCIGCNTCQSGCQSCQLCDTGCQTCDTCMSNCNNGRQALYDNQTIAAICTNAFSFRVTPVSGVTIIGPDPDGTLGYFCKSVWDDIATWISQRHTLDTGYDGNEAGFIGEHGNGDGGAEVAISSLSDVSPFKASEFNRISSIVGGTIVSGPSTGATVGDVIYASLFSDLVTAANNKTVDNGACKYCVAICDLTHNACVRCNESQCESYCQSCNTICNGCLACDNGECCNNCQGSCETCNDCTASQINSGGNEIEDGDTP